MKPCSGKTKTGKSCRAAAGPGGLCFFHANPDRVKSLGQIGGLKNRKFAGVDLQVPDNMTAADLRRLEVQVLKCLLAGEIQAREASSLAQMFQLIYRHQQAVDMEERLAVLEEAAGLGNTGADIADVNSGPETEHSAELRQSKSLCALNEMTDEGRRGPKKDEETRSAG